MAELERIGGIFWRRDSIWTEFYNTQLQAWYQQGMETIVGCCQNPNIKEVNMKWGHWIDGPKGWETYVMDEGNYTMDESGFFYQEVDVEKALPDKYGGSQSIQTVYIEGRDEDGNILYRHGMDADGKRFSFNEEVK